MGVPVSTPLHSGAAVRHVRPWISTVSFAEASGESADELAAAEDVQDEDGQGGQHHRGQGRGDVDGELALEAPHEQRQHPFVGALGEDQWKALTAELPRTRIPYERGCIVKDIDRSGFDAAARAAEQAEVCVAVVGDRAALFGLGTSGEGCDAEELSLPGVQDELLEALLATGTPVVLLVSGRPYALGAYADRAAAVVQALFPGEEGGPALAVLTGRTNPSGKLPVQIPRTAGGQPCTCTPRSAATPRA